MSASAEHVEDIRLQRLQEILASGAVREASRLLRSLAPAEIAHLLESMPPAERELIWNLVDGKRSIDQIIVEARREFINPPDAIANVQPNVRAKRGTSNALKIPMTFAPVFMTPPAAPACLPPTATLAAQ